MEDLLQIDMLETLRDIEIASQLIGSVGDTDEDPIDVHYKKLRCGIDPIPHNSDDFRLVKRYLERTHAPTHKVIHYAFVFAKALNLERRMDIFSSNAQALPT